MTKQGVENGTCICLDGKGGSEEEEEDRLLEKDAAVVPSGLPTGHRVNLEFFKL